MTVEKHLRSVSRAASQRLGILMKSWRVLHDRLLQWRCFHGFILPVLEYCSAVWCSAADTHLKLLDSVVSGTSFFNWGCVDPCQYYFFCTRSSVTRCTFDKIAPVSLWHDLGNPYSMVWDVLAGFKIRPICSLPFGLRFFSFSLLNFFLWAGVFGLIGC